jgi:hypothetical protein
MARRILLTLCIAALAAAAFWIARRGEKPDEGLIVHVQVEADAGTPLPSAQVQAVYTPGWRQVERSGGLRLTNVLLRAEERPSPDALRRAVQVRAPFYTLRRGSEPIVRPRDDGSWDMSFSLEHHGVFRLSVAETHLGSVKAYLEADEPEHRWEAMDRGNVARPDAPAAYRIYPGLKQLVVRLVGEPDKNGVVVAATQRIAFDAPGPGFLIEQRVSAVEVAPILGAIEAPADGPQPPSLAGLVHVVALGADGSRMEHGSVEVDHSGAFLVRTVGAGDYELEADCPWLEPLEPQLVRGGGSITLRADAVRPWLEVAHSGLTSLQDHDARISYEPGRRAAPQQRLYAKDHVVLALPPGPQPTEVVVEVPGTDTRAPMQGRAALGDLQPGGNAVALTLSEVPSGRVVVRVSREALEAAGGATVRLGAGRETTLIAKLAEEATFANVAAGDAVITIEWNRGGMAPTEKRATVTSGETSVVEIESGS